MSNSLFICIQNLGLWKSEEMEDNMVTHASVTFGSAAVGSKKSTATSNYRAAAVFPRSHNVAVTYVFIFRVAARGIYKLWRPKTWGAVQSLI